jgi:hypothetical protein
MVLNATEQGLKQITHLQDLLIGDCLHWMMSRLALAIMDKHTDLKHCQRSTPN